MTRPFGSVEPHGNGFRARFPLNGRKETLGTFATRESARLALDEFASKLTDRSPFVGHTLNSWGKTWLDERELNGAHRAMKDARSVWRARIATAPFADLPMAAITAQDVREWVKLQGRTPTKRGTRPGRQTIKNALNLLRVALDDAVDAGRISTNPAREVRVAKVASTVEQWTYLRQPEIFALCGERTPAPRRDLFTFAIYTGLRAGEIFGLLWSDVDWHHGTIHVRRSWLGTPTKKGHIREVPLFAPALEALRRQRGQANAASLNVWCAADGEPHTKGYDADLGRHLRNAGITRHVRFHDLRHTCASHLISGTWGRSWTLPEVAGWLGHMSVQSTQRYAHLCPDGLKRAFLQTPMTLKGSAQTSAPTQPQPQDPQ